MTLPALAPRIVNLLLAKAKYLGLRAEIDDVLERYLGLRAEVNAELSAFDAALIFAPRSPIISSEENTHDS